MAITLTPVHGGVCGHTNECGTHDFTLRTTSDTWIHQIPLIVDSDRLSQLHPEPQGTDSQIRPDGTHEIPIQIVNQGNRATYP